MDINGFLFETTKKMADEVDLWNYNGLQRTKHNLDSNQRCKRLKFDEIRQENCPFGGVNEQKSASTEIVCETSKICVKSAPKQTSLLSFFAQSSTVNVKKSLSIEPKSSPKSFGSSKKCPFYKFIEGAPYVVDAFNYGYVDNVQGYFLSHFHSDHYNGLNKNFQRQIYCGEVTANLVKFVLKVPPNYIHTLPLGEFVSLPDGTKVLLIDANHCPGSVMFLFHLKNGRYLLHTGDFRADEDRIVNLPFWANLKIDVIYLDTTYCDSQYVFPSQSGIIGKTLDFVSDELRRRPSTLICVGTYTIGKERIFSAIANLLDCKIFVDKKKFNILQCLNDDELKKRLTLNANDTCLHVLSMFQLSFEVHMKKLREHLSMYEGVYDSIVALKPTGWEFQKTSKNGQIIQISKRGNVTVAGIPYSEHSSCEELKKFIQRIRPKKILPTVNNGNAKSRQKMQNLFDSWMKNADSASKSDSTMRQWLTK